MHRIPDNIDLLLPFGEALRGFLEQPFLSASDLKHTLRARGVFQNRTEKRDAIPVLTCCLLSPAEFDELRERQATREDNPKTMTQTLPWSSTKSLLHAIPTELRLADLVPGDYTNYKIIGSPAFVPVGNNPDNITFEFEIEREDISKNWAATKNNFKGSLRIERIANRNTIKFILTHTADETKEVNRRFVQRLTQHFKDAGDVKREAEIEMIRFSSFDNEGRIAFFRSLTDRLASSEFQFSKTTDLGASPDDSVVLPPNLKWMEDNVSSLKLNGKALQDTIFIKDKACHGFLLFYAIDADFKFELPDAKGACSIGFEFPEFASKKERDLEFETTITSVTLDPGCAPMNRNDLKEELLRLINDYKLDQFERHRLRSDKPDVVSESSAASTPIQLEAPFALEPGPAPKRGSVKR